MADKSHGHIHDIHSKHSFSDTLSLTFMATFPCIHGTLCFIFMAHFVSYSRQTFSYIHSTHCFKYSRHTLFHIHDKHSLTCTADIVSNIHGKLSLILTAHILSHSRHTFCHIHSTLCFIFPALCSLERCWVRAFALMQMVPIMSNMYLMCQIFRR